MSFNYIGQPPYVALRPLSQEECRVGRLLVHPDLHNSIVEHIGNNPDTLPVRQYYAFLKALDHYHHLIKGTLQLLTNDSKAPIDPYLAIHNLQQLHRAIILNTDDSI